MKESEALNLKSYRARTAILISSLFILLLTQVACQDVNTFAFNKAETMIDGHKVVIKPCRESFTRTMSDTPENRHHLFSCDDNGKKGRVEIKNEALTVNGKSYGMLKQGDSIEVRDGKVFINKQEAVEVAQK